MTELVIVIGIFVTLIIIAFFAGYEIAFVTANRLNIELKKKQGTRNGKILSGFMENQAKLIGTCLVGLNIFLVIYGLLFDELLKMSLWNPWHIQNEYLKLIFDTLLSTMLVLLLGEFLPKAIFRAKNDSLLNFFAPVAKFFHGLFEPITNLLVNISQWILTYVLNVRINERNEAFSKIDLEHFFQQTREQDEEANELNTELFENALSLPMVKIRQCLVPRTEIEACELHTPIETLQQQFIQTQLSKLVIYDDNIDNIVGYVHQLDLFNKPANIQSILHPMMVVPETMSAPDLMNKFTKERKSIAWVVDEFGGTAGIVTMEDLLEEIFGEIRDEYDVEEPDDKLENDEYTFSGRLELDYLNEKYGLDFPNGNSETLSGYIIQQNESIPKQKDFIIINRFRFEILEVSDTRIEKVKMKIL
ncbi:MAG: hemolysin family protein [Chitinophagia bacterium]|jgi:CBS domain containing-hemolysin-like protein|nr:HlyC/CorC family transporter [Chitinophagia bacterium]